MRQLSLVLLALILLPVLLVCIEIANGYGLLDLSASAISIIPISIALLTTAMVVISLRLLDWINHKNHHH